MRPNLVDFQNISKFIHKMLHTSCTLIYQFGDISYTPNISLSGRLEVEYMLTWVICFGYSF